MILDFYDNETDFLLSKSIHIPKIAIVLIEGVFLQRAEWRDYYDQVIFLHCSKKKRFERESISTQRNRDKFERRYWPAEASYLWEIKPHKSADITLRNE
ncbi:hypothetical protein [Paenisporosarcina cavernae]|uniref:hypothetical protein n=1 Tax=Paenisporosarcina cavernae TaxID=2320858 RepID=UPI001EE509B8|nr:hypothetical protein [Paenisporosarcina cavernae]